MTNDLVLDSSFENTHAIETNYDDNSDNKDNGSRENNLNYIFDPNEYLEEPFVQTLDDNADTTTNTNKNTNFNFVAVGDWDCNEETEDTVDNIVDQEPELVLALGDFSYNGDAECWFEMIEPIAYKTEIVIGNHEVYPKDLTEDYMNYFGLKEQYYSFNYKNIHFLALSTETDYYEDSEQYKFAIRDLERYSQDPFIDWVIVFYHDHIYGSGSLEEEIYFREIYHPLFDKYKVDLALQGHHHVYERTYPITFNNEDDDEPIVHNNIPHIYKNPTISSFLTNTFNNDKYENAEFLGVYNNPNIYKNPKGTVFVTVGTGGAEEMELSSLEDFSAKGIDGTFGILDITLEVNQNTLTGTFIENGKKKEIMDEFKIVKE